MCAVESPGNIELAPALKHKLDRTTKAVLKAFPNSVAGVFVMGSITREPTPTSDLDVAVVYEDAYFRKNFESSKRELSRISKKINKAFPDHELILWASKVDHYRTLLPDVSYLRANLPTSVDRLDAWCGLAKHTLLHYEASSSQIIHGSFFIRPLTGIIRSEAPELLLLATRTFAEGLAEVASSDMNVRRSGANHIAKAVLRAAYSVLIRKDRQPRNSYLEILESSIQIIPEEHHSTIKHFYEIKTGKRNDELPLKTALQFLKYCELQIADVTRLQFEGLARASAGESFGFNPASLFDGNSPINEYSRFPGLEKNFLHSLYFAMSAQEIAHRFSRSGVSDGHVLDFYFEELSALTAFALSSPSGLRVIIGQEEKEFIYLELGLKLLQGLSPNLHKLGKLYLNNERSEFDCPWLSTDTKMARLALLLIALNCVPDVDDSTELVEELRSRINTETLLGGVRWYGSLFTGVFSEQLVEHLGDLALKMYQAGDVTLAQNILESVLSVNKIKAQAVRELGIKESLTGLDKKLSRVTQCYGVTFHRQGKIGEAKEQYLRAMKLDPNNYSALDDLTQLLLDHEPSDETSKLIGEVLQRFTTSEPEARREVAARYTSHAINLKLAGELLEAKVWYLRAIEISPEFEKAYYNLALLYQAINDNKAAIQSYREAIKLNPQYVKAYVNLASIFENEQKLDSAIDLLTEAVRRGIGDEQVFTNLGNCLWRRGDNKRARESYQCALKVDQNYANALNGMGILLIENEGFWDLKSLVLAASYFQRAFTADPTFEGARLNYYRVLAQSYNLPQK